MELEQKQPASSQQSPRRGMGSAPATTIAMVFTLSLIFGLVAACNALVFT